jgi:hypothetical protein
MMIRIASLSIVLRLKAPIGFCANNGIEWNDAAAPANAPALRRVLRFMMYISEDALT